MQLAQVDIYTHFFKLTKIHPFLIQPIKVAIDELTQIQYFKIRGRVQKQATKTYATATSDYSEFRFHINYLPRFKEILANHRLNFDNNDSFLKVEHVLYEPAEANVKMPESVVMRDYQETVIDYCISDGYSKLITLATGLGKLVHYQSNVLTSDGWITIKDLKVGDLVLTPRGTSTKVLEIFDYDLEDIYQVTFVDGRTAYCDGHHRWNVFDENNVYRTVTASEVISAIRNHLNWSIPNVSGEVEYDGAIDYHDSELSSIQVLWNNGYVIDNKYLVSSLRNRKIISEYIRSNELNDVTIIKQQANLLRSLGYSVTIHPDPNNTKKFYLQKHEIIDKLPMVGYSPFGKHPARCIRVDDPESLFILDEYVITHNTFTALKIGELLGGKILIVVLGRYVEKWVEDVIGAYGKDCDYVACSSSKDLLKLLLSCEAGNEPPNVTLVSTTTLQNYIKGYEKASYEERQNHIDPTRICELLKVSMRILDEAHQHFHANFKMDLYTHCPKTLSLTATLESQDKFMQDMYRLMWPLHTRTERMKPPAYDHTFALHYRHRDASKVRHMGSQGYSHILYEQSIWKHIPSRLAYLEMIGDTVEEGFLPYYKPGRKMLIFCSLVETCDQVAEYLSKRFAEKKWQISRFIAGDPKEYIDTNDITVSTLGRAGTALDVYGLITCLMTVALSEPKANIQAKGRLRNIQVKEEFADVVPKFYYFVADDLEKPRQYYEQKKILFAERTLKQTDEYLRITVGDPISELYPNGIPEYVKER